MRRGKQEEGAKTSGGAVEYVRVTNLVSLMADLKERETAIPVKLESDGTPLVFGAESERSLLMIIREALQNALRHAAPKNLSIWLSFERQHLQVKIADDGCGFDTALIHSSPGRH